MALLPASKKLLADLQQIPVFSRVSALQLRSLLEGADLLDLPSRRVVSRSGGPASHLHVLLEGSVRVFHQAPGRTEPGSQVTVKQLTAPCTFSEKEILADEHLVESTQTLTRSRIMRVPRERFLALLRGPEDMTRRVLDDVCRRFCIAIRHEHSLLAPVPVRLASLLIAYAEWFGVECAKGVRLRLPLTQHDLADGLGAGLRSVSRVLTAWIRDGLLVRDKGWLVIRDLQRLVFLSGSLRFNLNYGRHGGPTRRPGNDSVRRRRQL